MEQPTYYSILPANVRYSKKLSSLEKLLFSEITGLTNSKGYCWATNEYFARLYGKSKGTISRCINKLLLSNFIKVKMIKESKDYVEKRLITITGVEVLKNIKAHSQKQVGGVVKKRKENTKDNNIKNKDILFSRFWDAYNFKKSRKLCYTKFLSLSYETCEKCVVAAKEYSASITDIKFKKHPGTWLNQGCWDDEITQRSTNDGKIQGGKYDGMVF
jgi:hypothetical protein